MSSLCGDILISVMYSLSHTHKIFQTPQVRTVQLQHSKINKLLPRYTLVVLTVILNLKKCEKPFLKFKFYFCICTFFPSYTLLIFLSCVIVDLQCYLTYCYSVSSRFWFLPLDDPSLLMLHPYMYSAVSIRLILLLVVVL